MAALRAVVPGAGDGDRAEHRVGHLAPVGGEFCLVALAAGHSRAAVARVCGQQLCEHAAAELQHPSTDHGLRRLQARVTAAQRPGGLRGQPAYLGGLLLRERVPEPPFSPPGRERTSSPAAPGGDAGRASQIASFTSAIRSASDVNSA